MKTFSGSNDDDDGAGAGAAGSSAGAAAAGASASAGASDSVVSARSGFTALGVLNTKPEHAAIERIKAVARIFAAVVDVFALFVAVTGPIAAWAVSVY